MSDISSVEWLPTFGHRFLRHNPLGPLPAYAYGAYADEKGAEEKSKQPKPSYSYASLIRLAITNCPKGKMTLSEIYQYIIETFPYYRDAGTGWKNSIRHNLSLNKCFRKLARGKDDPGKGSYWAIDVNYSQDDASGKRRKGLHSLRGAPYSPECSSNSSGEAGMSGIPGIKEKEHGVSETSPGTEVLLKQEANDAPDPPASEDSLSVLDLFSASFSPPESVPVPVLRVCSSGRHRGTHTDRYGNFNEQVEEECNCSPFDEVENSQVKAVNIPEYSQYSLPENLSANYETGYGSFSSCSEVCSPVQMEVGFFDTPIKCVSSHASYKYGSYVGQNCEYGYCRNDSRDALPNGIGMRNDVNTYENSPLNGFDCL